MRPATGPAWSDERRSVDSGAGLLEPAQVYLAGARLSGATITFELPDFVRRAGWNWPPVTEDETTFFSGVELRVRWANDQSIRIRFRLRLSHRAMAVWMVRTSRDAWTVIWSPSWDEVADDPDPQLIARAGHTLPATVLVSSTGLIEWTNERFRMLAGVTSEVRGNGIGAVLPADMSDALERIVDEVGRGEVVDRLLPSIRPGLRWLRVHASPAPRPDTGELLIAMQFEEVSAGQDALRGPVDAAVRDPLTDLYNRRALFDIADLDDPADSPFTAVVVLDIRRFRSINDVWGQLAADDSLVAVAQWLRESAGENDIVVLLVGDQFLVLSVDAQALLARITEQGELSVRRGRQQIMVTLQAGYAARAPGQRLLQIAERAEHALEAAKASATDRVAMWNQELARSTSARISSEESVRRAIRAAEVLVHFQPLVDVAASRVRGMEALVRLGGDSAGIPAEVIVAASQQLGMQASLTEQVCEQAFAGAASLRSVFGPLHVAVNLAREAIAAGAAVDAVLDNAVRAGIPVGDVWIELTEEFAVGVSTAGLIAELHRAAEHGLAIVVDDFGRGETALSLLRRLPLAAIKLDRSLVPEEGDEDGWRFVDGTVSLLHTLAPLLVVEGVETREQSRRLNDIGVHVQQGYLFGAPQPLDFWLAHPEAVGIG